MVVVDARGVVLAREDVRALDGGVRRADGLRAPLAARKWAVEGATGVGKHLSQRLVVGGETVFDVPSKKSSLVRVFAGDQRAQVR